MLSMNNFKFDDFVDRIYPIVIELEIKDTIDTYRSAANFTRRTLGSVASLLAANFYQGNPDRNHTLWNIN
jgi:hypothetical protein